LEILLRKLFNFNSDFIAAIQQEKQEKELQAGIEGENHLQ
jgi:hypothetical protein